MNLNRSKPDFLTAWGVVVQEAEDFVSLSPEGVSLVRGLLACGRDRQNSPYKVRLKCYRMRSGARQSVGHKAVGVLDRTNEHDDADLLATYLCSWDRVEVFNGTQQGVWDGTKAEQTQKGEPCPEHEHGGFGPANQDEQGAGPPQCQLEEGLGEGGEELGEDKHSRPVLSRRCPLH